MYRFLMGVPTGSMPSEFVSDGLLREFMNFEVNKKLAFSHMSAEEVLRFWEPKNLHTWSGVEDKLEVAKLRSLTQGS